MPSSAICAGFTAFSETVEPEEVLGVLRDYHAVLGRLVVEHGGTLEHFAGDGRHVFFNDPIPQDDHEMRGRPMAVAMRVEVAGLGRRVAPPRLRARLRLRHRRRLRDARAASASRDDTTTAPSVTPSSSRHASRPEAGPGQILLDQRTYAAVEDRVEAEPVGELHPKGVSRPISAYNIVALR